MKERSKRPTRLPGDLTNAVGRMIRVDHAGEYGAARIYAGQLAVMGHRHRDSATISHMAEQEARHLDTFDRLITERKVRPTLLGPVWHVAGFALGAATALLGPKAAMACTAAVESVIEAHYAVQRDALEDTDPELSAIIDDFRKDELEHRATALANGAEDAVGYSVMAAIIKAGCHAAIAVTERI